MLLRILASIMLLFSVLFMPFWLSVILALGAMIYFNIFLEAVALFLLSDLLYGAPEVKFRGVVFISFVSCLIVFIIIEITKRRLKFYSNK